MRQNELKITRLQAKYAPIALSCLKARQMLLISKSCGWVASNEMDMPTSHCYLKQQTKVQALVKMVLIPVCWMFMHTCTFPHLHWEVPGRNIMTSIRENSYPFNLIYLLNPISRHYVVGNKKRKCSRVLNGNSANEQGNISNILQKCYRCEITTREYMKQGRE